MPVAVADWGSSRCAQCGCDQSTSGEPHAAPKGRRLRLLAWCLCVTTLVVSGPSLVSAQPRDVAGATVDIADPEQQDDVLGADDVLAIAVMQAPELNVTARISARGEISMPLVGAIHAGGRTAADVARAIEQRLAEKYIKHPNVTIHVTEVNSQPVTVVGAVRRPGVVQIRRPQRLLDVLSLAGGVADEAGAEVMVRRRSQPGSVPVDAARSTSSPAVGDGRTVVSDGEIVRVKLAALLHAREPQANIVILPGDVVTIPPAATVYVIGAVNKPGAFSLHGHDSLTVLRALALVGGVARTAADARAVLLRGGAAGDRLEVPVDVRAILKGQKPDVALEADDVLFVPSSGGKVMARATVDALARIVTLRTVVTP